MITDKDIKKLKEAFATKDDLKSFATKDDLRSFATKDDLKSFATKDDLKSFATKDDFKDLKVNLISAMEKVFPTRIEMDSHFDDFRQEISDMQTSVDAYSKKADTYFQEMQVLSHKQKRTEGWTNEIAEKVGVELKY